MPLRGVFWYNKDMRRNRGLPRAVRHSSPQVKSRGFTLLELLIVIAMLAILAVVIILIINPAETLRKGRDSQRLSDLASLESALQIAILDQSLTGTADPDGTYVNSCVGESVQRIFVSVPTGETAPTPPSGWNLARVSQANLGLVNGSGWMPMDLTTVQGGSPFGNLPIDPTNTFASGLYYTYTCSRNPHYALSANLMESQAFRRGGVNDKTSNDGGYDPDMYEIGTDLTLNPLTPVGYWPLDGGTTGGITTGTTAGFEDASVNSNNGTANNPDVSGMAWAVGKLGGAVNFDNFDDDVTIPHNVSLTPTTMTISAWIKLNSLSSNHDTVVGKIVFSGDPALASGYALTPNSSGSGWIELYSRDGVLITNLQTGSGVLQTGIWHYVAATIGSDGRKIYLDGNLVASNSDQTSVAANTEDFTIGRRTDGSGYFDGQIDDVRIYNRVLPAVEIQARASL